MKKTYQHPEIEIAGAYESSILKISPNESGDSLSVGFDKEDGFADYFDSNLSRLWEEKEDDMNDNSWKF